MAKSGKTDTIGASTATGLKIEPTPRSVPIAANGVVTGEDFARLMSALMSDVVEGRVTPDVAHAACNAGGKLLKVVEMQYKYAGESKTAPSLLLAPKARS